MWYWFYSPSVRVTRKLLFFEYWIYNFRQQKNILFWRSVEKKYNNISYPNLIFIVYIQHSIGYFSADFRNYITRVWSLSFTNNKFLSVIRSQHMYWFLLPCVFSLEIMVYKCQKKNLEAFRVVINFKIIKKSLVYTYCNEKRLQIHHLSDIIF